jgi:hypothetical protein
MLDKKPSPPRERVFKEHPGLLQPKRKRHSNPSTEQDRPVAPDFHQINPTKMTTPSLSTLHHITARKLTKLSTAASHYATTRSSILASASAAPTTLQKLRVLLTGFEELGITTPHQADLSLRNLDLFLQQAQHDASISEALLGEWASALERELEIGGVKFEYAGLFGKLVTEWLRHPNPSPGPAAAAGSHDESDSDADMRSSGFDQVGRKEMHEQRRRWESYAFTEKEVDHKKLEAYLDGLFSAESQVRKLRQAPVEILREHMSSVMDFKSDLHTEGEEKPDSYRHQRRFTVERLKDAIQGVLHSDLLAGQKREALVDLQSQSEAVLEELVHVLNMDLEGLDLWEWDPSPVPLHMRRQLNGRYRVYMDEETHQAILLHFVGKTWAVAFKKAFFDVQVSGAWLNSPHRSISRKARHRRAYFIPDDISVARKDKTVRSIRRSSYQEEYFMTQLPDEFDEAYIDYAAEDQDANAERNEEKGRSPLATKQGQLRLLTAEMLLNTKIYDEFTILQSDFKMFGPSMSHDTIITVLRYFGVPAKWLRFFKKFLQAPVVFAQDGPNGEVRVRKCGIPMSHILSDALSEAVLFCLDFAVNKRTGGSNIYRFHDDLWFWGQEDRCIKAWDAMKEFAEAMGLELNVEKTGAALIFGDKGTKRELSPRLPSGKVKWGFLVLDASAGRWIIDRAQVDEHIEELRRQLGACRSVMAWVQAWNSYVNRFFRTNFGQPAICFGRDHNTMIIETFEHIQRSLFADEGIANAAEYLRSMLKDRFGTDDSVPDAFIYYPTEFGGLGLRNPFIEIFLTRKWLRKTPQDYLNSVFEEELETYEHKKQRFNNDVSKSYKPVTAADPSDEPFMSFEEYMRYPEDTSYHLALAYNDLMGEPHPTAIEAIEVDSEIKAVVNKAGRNVLEKQYWSAIYALYSPEVKRKFGGVGLQLGERDLLPVGLVDVLRGERVRWDG